MNAGKTRVPMLFALDALELKQQRFYRSKVYKTSYSCWQTSAQEEAKVGLEMVLVA